jgi:hypothetical protein
MSGIMGCPASVPEIAYLRDIQSFDINTFHMADDGPCSDEVAIVRSMGDDRDVGDGEVLILKVLRPPHQATCCIVVSLVLTGFVGMLVYLVAVVFTDWVEEWS